MRAGDIKEMEWNHGSWWTRRQHQEVMEWGGLTKHRICIKVSRTRLSNSLQKKITITYCKNLSQSCLLWFGTVGATRPNLAKITATWLDMQVLHNPSSSCISYLIVIPILSQIISRKTLLFLKLRPIRRILGQWSYYNFSLQFFTQPPRNHYCKKFTFLCGAGQ